MVRLTRDVRRQIIEKNEGFSTHTYNEQKNFRENRIYTIANGELRIRASGKTSWADSHYDKEWIASDEETHRFLYNNKNQMDLDGIENASVSPRTKKSQQEKPVIDFANSCIKESETEDYFSYNNENVDNDSEEGGNSIWHAVGDVVLAILVTYGIYKAAPYVRRFWNEKALPSFRSIRTKIVDTSEHTTTNTDERNPDFSV